MRAEPTSSSTIRVFLVDGDEVGRSSIERIVEGEADIELLAFDSGEAALAEYGRAGCDCLLLVCRTSEPRTLELLEQLEPSVSAILLTDAGQAAPTVGSKHVVVEAIDHGALTRSLLLTKLRGVQRERELRSTIEALRRAVHVRENMIGVMSHDLGGPLNNISLAIPLLETEDPNLRATALGSVRRALARAERLIGDLAELSRILDPGFRIDRRAVVARGLIDAAVLGEQSAMRAKQVEVVISTPETLGEVYADRDRVIQVLGHLLRSALVHTPESGTITVEARLRGHDELEFAVIDESPDSSATRRTYMLDRFWESKDGARSVGSDLGLAIAKGLVTAHEGEMGVESLPRGARCWFAIRRPPTE